MSSSQPYLRKSLFLFDTERKKKAEVVAREGKVSLYCCGPTLYAEVHIGNWRTFLCEDLLRRTLEVTGIEVDQVMNLTDVDDKTIKAAAGSSLAVITLPYREMFFRDVERLRLRPARGYPAATEYIPQMIALIEDLIGKGKAYRGVDGSVYFSIKSFADYGRLSGRRPVKGIDLDTSIEDECEDGSDFALWKSYQSKRDGDVFWSSPFGLGRPGWHIECSAMALHLLGDRVDIHAGGIDNLFPHHENEIAQCEGVTGSVFVNHWFHIAHVLVDGKKMAKSLGNSWTLSELVGKGYDPLEIRYYLLSAHYRSPLHFSLEGLKKAKQSLERAHSFVRRLAEVSGEDLIDITSQVNDWQEQFTNALLDDLQISQALSVLFALVRQSNYWLENKEIGKKGAGQLSSCLEWMNQTLGFIPLRGRKVPQEILELATKRHQLRMQGDWKKADALRLQLAKMGYAIEDTPAGPRVRIL